MVDCSKVIVKRTDTCINSNLITCMHSSKEMWNRNEINVKNETCWKSDLPSINTIESGFIHGTGMLIDSIISGRVLLPQH